MGLGLENPLHLAIVLTVVLLLFGAKRLPEAGRSLGESMRGFRQGITGAPSDSERGEDNPAPRLCAEDEDVSEHRRVS